ncbi:hypothetical protein ACIQVU_07940 [Lysinibacillus sp. NPDC098008]|uniref:hypothetical protein n=1 Tax=Lysinibacillus sp. NPDC098008 TaxID=3364146 RepID=UPI0038097589
MHTLLHSAGLQTDQRLSEIYGAIAKGSPLTARFLFQPIKGASITFSRKDGLMGAGTRYIGQEPEQTKFNYKPVTEKTSIFYADFRYDKNELSRMVNPEAFLKSALEDQAASISRAFADEVLNGTGDDSGLKGAKYRVDQELLFTAIEGKINIAQLQMAQLALQPANVADVVILVSDQTYVQLVDLLASKHLLERSKDQFENNIVSFNGSEIIRMSTFQKQVDNGNGTFSTITVNPLPFNETVVVNESTTLENTGSIYLMNLAPHRFNGIEGEAGITTEPYTVGAIYKGVHMSWDAGIAEYSARSVARIQGLTSPF